MSKMQRRRWSGAVHSQKSNPGCIPSAIGIVVCVGAFVNLIVDAEGERAFFEKALPIELGMSERRVISIMGPADEAEDIEMKWGIRADFETAAEPPYYVDVPQESRGPKRTRHLTWHYGRNTRLHVYLINDRVISTDKYTRRSKH